MIRLANTSLRRPKLTLIVWLVVVAGLGFVGSRIGDRFSPSVLVVQGTQSARAQDIARSRFGNSVLVPIMLKGPAAQLDRQGPALVKALRARPDARSLSPWDKTPGSSELRPQPGVATIVTAVEQNTKDPNHEPLAENLARLKAARTIDGKQYTIVELPLPRPVVFRNQRLPASYANFYIANGLVLVPTFHEPSDRIALGIMADLFPDREVIGIHAVDLVWGLGTLHCMTQQQPAALPSAI